METFVIVPLFFLGLIIGSFLNVVILRFNTGLKASKGRSMCFSCGKPLEWHELLPVLSFINQKGACRGCGAKISWQYPLVELAGAAALIVAGLRSPGFFESGLAFAHFAALAVILCLYIVIVAYDIRHKTIPDAFSYGAAVASLALIGIDWLSTGAIGPAHIVAGPALFLFFWFFWKVSKGTWMGLGDGKLALSIGWTLGLSGGIAALLLSFWIGAILTLCIMAFQAVFLTKRGLGFRSQIPFGPFLVLGFLVVLIWSVDVQAILSHLAV